MTKDDVLFGYRLQLFALANELGNVSEACRLMGVNRSTYVGQLRGSKGPVWQVTAIDTYSSFAWVDPVVCPPAGPTVAMTSRLAQRVARELQAAGWQLQRVLTDNGSEFGRRAFAAELPDGVRHSQIRSGRPQTNGHVERLHRTILEECWRPAFARFVHVRFSGLARTHEHYIHDYNYDREHHGRITQRPTTRRARLRCPQDGAPMSRTCRHNSESVQLAPSPVGRRPPATRRRSRTPDFKCSARARGGT